MKKNQCIILLTALIVCSASRAQLTSYGGLVEPGTTSGTINILDNSYFGSMAGFNNLSGHGNTFIGNGSGHHNTSGGDNTFVGARSGRYSTTGSFNTFLGTNSGQSGYGSANTFVGYNSGYSNQNNNNTFIGTNSGNNNTTGSGNIFLGYQAGYNETGSNLLYIDNSSTSSPLIWGDFASDLLRINGTLNINNAYSFPATDGLANQILSTDGSGTVSWVAAPVDTDTQLSEAQVDGFVANNGYLTTEVDGSVSNEIQDLSLSGNTLSLSGDGTTVDLSPYLDNTDTQLSEAQVDGYVANNGYLTAGALAAYAPLSDPNFTGTIVIGSTPKGVIDASEKLRMTGSASDYIISVQDGTGRVQHYWNASTYISGTSSYLVSGEAAGKILFSPTSSTVFGVYYAPSGTAGDPISWDEKFTVTSSGTITATSFQGNGASLTALNADNISSGTLAATHIPDLDTSKITTGTFDIDRINTNFGSKNIYTTGNVGIGTTSPGAKLEIYDGDFTLKTDNNAEDQSILFQNSGNSYTWRIYRTDAGNNKAHLKFASGLTADFTNLTDRVTFENNGNVGINVPDAQATLHVNGSVRLQGLNQDRNYNKMLVIDDNGNLAHRPVIEPTPNEPCECLPYYKDSNATNTYLGDQAGGQDTTINNSTAIGYTATATASNQVRIGNAAVNSIGGVAPWATFADARFKQEVREDIPGLEFISQLRPVSYETNQPGLDEFLGKDSSEDATVKTTETSQRRNIGFVAQEVEAVLQAKGYTAIGIEAPQNENDPYSIRYAEFVVPLVKAVQEQQEIIEALQQQNQTLQQEIESIKTMVYGDSGSVDTSVRIVAEDFALYQNVPNPFDKTTSIKALIPESVRQAKIIVYNLQGMELENYTVEKRGEVSVDISAGHFPSGMYLYALMADGQLIDTKKMILTR